jgi:hypothetical protein
MGTYFEEWKSHFNEHGDRWSVKLKENIFECIKQVHAAYVTLTHVRYINCIPFDKMTRESLLDIDIFNWNKQTISWTNEH